ncbi:MAG: hypothetical protein DRJ69_04530 [Thermoprotei archaeon]|nr:MAG: hypothetical protein DRJ69_04530 [Thermoprotei archaeon]
MSSTDWRSILVEELSEKPRYEPDWRRPSRRIIAVSTEIARQRGWPVVPPCYHPSRYKYVYEKPRIAIVLDVSGAISKDFYKAHIEELNNCIKRIKPEELWVLYCDNQVRRVKHYKQPGAMMVESPESVPSLRGSSAYTPAFRYIGERRYEIRVKGIVYLTDLRPGEPWEKLSRELPTLFYRTGAEKLLWLVPSDVKEDDFWEPPIGKIVWI